MYRITLDLNPIRRRKSGEVRVQSVNQKIPFDERPQPTRIRLMNSPHVHLEKTLKLAG